MNPAALLDRGNLMLLMAILPMMLIGTILVVTSFDARGLLGPRRKVSLQVPLAAIAAGLALSAAAVRGGSQFAQGFTADGANLFALATVFQFGWGFVHFRARNAASATVGMLAAGVAVGASLVGHVYGSVLAGAQVALSDLFGVSFEVALILALVPQVAPALAARLAERQMKVQRATVLSVFCLAITALFTSLALIG
jgi:hypothetical protein